MRNQTLVKMLVRAVKELHELRCYPPFWIEPGHEEAEEHEIKDCPIWEELREAA
jgi:hypothetical protein